MAAKDIWDYHVATGCPLGRAEELLSAMSPDLRERVLLAIKQKGDGWLLVDPIETDAILAGKVREAADEASRAADVAGRHRLGRCHFVWAMQKKILAERYGITWFSPADMNPAVFFD
ncbi:hypothetical protein RKE25_09880 [Dyella sp. BiH032]|uniref:hypothetical protein n=1 Tax=Dyella sp. BiH032 TaxID=3075430 RepID=UPI0028936815|nr:hypothetical protein [Dyella sp. BiH032]WNL47908.1 hypothetical protein RKE25_09880 [Dyella sp. BiH032]